MYIVIIIKCRLDKWSSCPKISVFGYLSCYANFGCNHVLIKQVRVVNYNLGVVLNLCVWNFA